MNKKIMSIVAAAAILTTGASAFNTNTDGKILATPTVEGNYTWDVNNKSANGTLLSWNWTSVVNHGDAILYPYYTQKDGWASEIYVRNDGNRNIVAKVAIYTANDSQEIKDFNIYLSPNDVFRFEIKDGKIFLNEDSVVTMAPLPQDRNNEREHSSAEVKFGDTHPVELPFDVESGYIVVYGMAEARTDNANDPHHEHVKMFGDYRQFLDKYRAGWRDGFGVGSITNFENGTYKNGIAAPALLGDGTLTTDNYEWHDASQVLTGTVRLYKDADENNGARDMILNATYMNNYTDENIVVWTEGETASLADRRLDDNGSGYADYSAHGVGSNDIAKDAYAFATKGFFFRFDNGSGSNIANQIIFNQPLKRVLTQLGNTQNIWTLRQGEDVSGFVTGEEYEFKTSCDFWDEKENSYVAVEQGGSGLITSPYNGEEGVAEYGYNQEIQILTDEDLEKAEMFDGRYDNINGYVSCDINSGTEGWMPAIVTQMIGSDVGGNALTNWIYSVRKSN
jgi:hypothetical protein